mgnify:CR=1 FL=1
MYINKNYSNLKKVADENSSNYLYAKPFPSIVFDNFFEGFSPILPPSEVSSPVNNFPFKKVPAVNITLSDLNSFLFFRITPLTL